MTRNMTRLMTLSGLVLGCLMLLAGTAAAGTHYAFVKFEADSGATLKNIGGETLDRAEWIQCKRVSYGLKRDIGTGARVSGHTHYDRIEFDMPQGPATPVIMQGAPTGTTVNMTIRFYSTPTPEGKPVMEITRKGQLVRSTREGTDAKLVVDLNKPVDAPTVTRAKALVEAAPAAAPTPTRAR